MKWVRPGRRSAVRLPSGRTTGRHWQTSPVRDLDVLTDEPLNAETRLDRQYGAITPTGRHYVRTHFAMPDPSAELAIEGDRRITLAARQVRALGGTTLAVTLECAGNGRRFIEPATPGEQWGLGAVGTAEWTGAPLRLLLERAGVGPGAREVLFRGADRGVVADVGARVAYERSLPIADARREDVIVAWAMNGRPIPREHGGPLRLVVPGWYGMASVKWLATIAVLDRSFDGFYQRDRYVIDGRPLREIAPRAVITSPGDGALLSGSILEIRGYAWSGAARIERVTVGVGADRADADLGEAPSAYAWRPFTRKVALASAERLDLVVSARATDAAGNVQPEVPVWNALGYGNNAVRPVRVRLSPR